MVFTFKESLWLLLVARYKLQNHSMLFMSLACGRSLLASNLCLQVLELQSGAVGLYRKTPIPIRFKPNSSSRTSG